jgi:hypothetical protein
MSLEKRACPRYGIFFMGSASRTEELAAASRSLRKVEVGIKRFFGHGEARKTKTLRGACHGLSKALA